MSCQHPVVDYKFFTFAILFISAKFVASRALALGTAWYVDAMMRASEIGQSLVDTLVNVETEFSASGQREPGRTTTVGRSLRVGTVVRTAKVARQTLVDV